MKILKRHTGFTTNSSGASEWVEGANPFEDNPYEEPGAAPGTQSENGVAPPAAGVAETGALAPGALRSTNATDAPDATEARTEAPSGESPEPAASPASPGYTNALVIGGLVLLVAGIFVVDRAVCRLMGMRGDEDE